MNINKVKQATTADEARQYAIEWQNEIIDDEDYTYGELAEWQVVFEQLADTFPELRAEFIENNII